MDYDPLRIDAYAEHLSEVNQVKDVIASDDILNEQGAILVKKGQKISRETVERIVRFKLIKPLEANINIDDALNPEKILADMNAIFEEPQTRVIHDKYSIATELTPCLKAFFSIPVLSQKLTVMSLQMIPEYRKALFVGWYCLVLGKKLGLSMEQLQAVFIAGLCHDIGMLHIPRYIIRKKETLTAEEWRAIQSHVVVGQKILEQINNLPSMISRAILEHHEFCDGTGYPYARQEHELGLLGQMVGMADTVVAIYTNKLRPKERGPRDLIPILQINVAAHRLDVGGAAIQTLRELNLQEQSQLTDDTVVAFIDQVLQEDANLSQSIHHIEELVNSLPQDSPKNSSKRQIFAARQVFAHLMTVLRGSGILDPGYIRFLEQVKIDKLQVAYREIEDVSFMLQEVRWNLSKIMKILTAIADENSIIKSAEEQEKFSAVLRSIEL